MTKEDLHKIVKQFVYATIMTFKEYRGIKNEELVNEIIQSATRMSAQCREACENQDVEKAKTELHGCSDFLSEVLYLMNLLEHSRTIDEINVENIVLEGIDLKQKIDSVCKK
ncbi:MAG: hypothetical protein ABFS35_10305 [Bacteroidota bacterium]